MVKTMHNLCNMINRLSMYASLITGIQVMDNVKQIKQCFIL